MQIGPYTLIRELGRGGMAQVWLAHRVWEDGERRPCVIKFPRRNAVTDEGMLRQFLEEWRLAIRLRHNNIVSVFDAGVHEGLPYLVMNYVAGKDLAEIIRTLSRLGKRFDVETAVYVVRELGQALACAHGYEYQGVPQQIVHRDVASKNAMIDGWGGVLLMDFGVATSLMTQTSRMHVKGTLAYMAPEHYLGQASAISDVFGLGTILWEMLAGRPYRGGLAGQALIAAVVAGTVEPVGRELPDVVQRVLDAMLEPVASKRIPLLEVLIAFEDFPSRQRLLQEMMATYFGRAGKRTGLSSIHFAASKELTDTLAVVKVSGVSMSEIRRRKMLGRARGVPLGFVPERTEDTAKMDLRANTAGVDDDLDEDAGSVPAVPAVPAEAVLPIEQPVFEQSAAKQPVAKQANERPEGEHDDDLASAMTNRWRTPAGTVRATRALVPAAVVPVVEAPTPQRTTVRALLAPTPLTADAPQAAALETDASDRVPRGGTRRSPGSSDPRPPETTVRLQVPLAVGVDVAGRTDFLPLPVVEHAEPPPSSPQLRERPRAESSPPRRSLLSLSMLAPLMLMLMLLGMTAWSLWPDSTPEFRGSEADPAVSSVAVADKPTAVVAAMAKPTRDAELDSVEVFDEAPVLEEPVPIAQPEPVETTAPAVEPDPTLAANGPEPTDDPATASPPEPEPESVPRTQAATADEGSSAKQAPRSSKPKPAPKLELVVRRGLMVDHAEIRVGRGKVTTVPRVGSATLHVAPGTYTLRYRTKPNGEWKEKRHTFSPNTAYFVFLELGGLRINGSAKGKSP